MELFRLRGTSSLYSRDAFDDLMAENPGEDPRGFGGFVDPKTKTIVIPSDAKAAEVFEEFGHAALRDIIGTDADAKRATIQDSWRVLLKETQV